MYIPTIFIVVLLVPVLPSSSVTVHVWTPASCDVSMLSLMVSVVALLAKQSYRQVEDHS